MSGETIADNMARQLLFCAEMQSRLRAWHPEYEWTVTPKLIQPAGGGVSVSSYGSSPGIFLILAGDSKHSVRGIKPLACLSCDGEQYANADDQEQWLRRAAGQLLAELRSRRN